MSDLIDEVDSQIEEMSDKLHKIRQWCEAYPLDVFPEPDFKKAAKVLKEHDMTIDAISASNMRHVLNGIKKILDKQQDLMNMSDKQTADEQGKSSVERVVKPLCTDCKHCSDTRWVSWCGRREKEITGYSAVNGKPYFYGKTICHDERDIGKCGPEGKYFEPSWWKSLKDLFAA